MTDTADLSPTPKPSPPVEPESWECCGSGCEPCVYDRYWDELARYEAALKAWEEERVTRKAGPGPSVDKAGTSP